MALYMNCFSLASVLPDLNYSLKHTSNLRSPETVHFRINCLEFWAKHGLAAAIDYSGVSKSTLYVWRKSLDDSRKRDRMGRASLYALDPKSTRPRKCKSSHWNPLVVKYVKDLILEHPELGKQKVYQFLKRHLERLHLSLLLVSESTVGRIIKWLREMGRLPGKDKLTYHARTGRMFIRRKKHIRKQRRADLPFRVKYPGDLVQIDGVEGHHDGKHFYIINAIDYVSGKVASRLFYGKSSASTANFLSDLPGLLDLKIKAIQTDNGSEYTAKFHQKVEAMGIAHCFNYVKKPIYNGKVERFNRTLQDALKYDLDFLYDVAYDLDSAQATLQHYIDFYNNDRPHSSISHLTPTEYVLQYFQRKPTFQKVLN